MTSLKLFFAFLINLLILCNVQAQLVINEISNRNSTQAMDEDGEYPDWLELYNNSETTCELSNYYLSDDSSHLEKWHFEPYTMKSKEHLLVFASGKNRYKQSGHWESPVLPQDTFAYIIPNNATPANWNQPGFDTVGWLKGIAGFGYDDNDDNTLVPYGTMAVYIRKTFSLPSNFSFKNAALHVDYDDGFVAYLNGTEIARANISGTPTYNSAATTYTDATGTAGKISIDTSLIRSLLVEGENVFAIEVHNVASSSDLSLIPYFSLLVSDSLSIFSTPPAAINLTSANKFHTNFKISSKGEKVFLFNKIENKTDTVWIKDLLSGWSMGRAQDGSQTWAVFINPTPGRENTTTAYTNGREPEPIFSVPEGFYPSTQTVTLSSTSSTAKIFYTTDGSEPSSYATLYKGEKITVSASKVIRAICYSSADKLPSHSVGNSYFINNTGHSVPVVSISINNTSLYGSYGIFDNTDKEWERGCYVEYFDANKKKVFEQASGIQIDGGAGGSRSNPQHSFRLEFGNNSFGDGNLEYNFHPDHPKHNNYKSIYLRNGSNQWLNFMFKDAMECKMMSSNTKNDYSAFEPAVVYINGQYFGMYELREKLNDEFFEENYKANIDSGFHLLSLSYYYNLVLRALNGSVDTFKADYNRFIALNQSDANYLEKANKILDLDYYTDYIVAQSWIADIDWPNNNIKIVKGDFTNYRWRFLLQDLEWSLYPNGWSSSSYDHISYMRYYDSNIPYIRFWQELIKNSTYKKQFINRFADIMNSSYLPDNILPIAQDIYDETYPEMRNEYVKWSGSAVADNKMNAYQSNMSTFRSEITQRSGYVRNHIVSNFGLSGKYNLNLKVEPETAGVIQVNTITPESYPWTGVYFSGVPIKLEAKAVGNYKFVGWRKNSFITDTLNPVVETDVRTSTNEFVAVFEKLPPPEQAVTISEINYSTCETFPTTDWFEIYNYGEKAVDLTGWYVSDKKESHKWIIPGSAQLKAGERLVLASNTLIFNIVYPDVKNVVGSFEFGLGTSDSVQLFNNKKQLVAGVKYNSVYPWPTEAYNEGRTLELKDPNGSLNSFTNWKAGCIGGSPGTAYTKCQEETEISEIGNSVTARLYPNPANDQINIILPTSMNNQKVTCRILDMMGKEVKTQTFQATEKTAISVSNIADGVYILQITSANAQQTLKFIKRK
jgi:hypothetical protein